MKSTFLSMALALMASPALSCVEPDTLFYFTHKPGSIDDFLGKGPGIVLPSFDTRYLIAAYRMLGGKPLAPKDAAALRRYLQELETDYYPGDRASGAPDVWLQARRAAGFTDATDIISPYSGSAEYTSYMNCNPDAFASAAELLKVRLRGYGAGSRQIKEWVAAQDTVFRNCSHAGNTEDGIADSEVFLPEPPKPGDKAQVIRDREYQTAAAYFYAGNYEEARKRFQTIARDRRSEYSKLARYLVLRTYIRNAFMAYGSAAKTQEEYFSLAEKEAMEILADSSLSPIHRMTRQLLNLVRFRTAPQAELKRLGAYLSGEWSDDADWRNALTDYSMLIRSKESSGEDPDAMTDWILALKGSREGVAGYCTEKWKAGGGEIWLLAALARTEENAAYPEELMKAAEAIPATSPAYLSIAYQRMRILCGCGRSGEAAQLAAALLKSGITLSMGDENLITEYAMKAAGSLNEYIQLDARTPVQPSYQGTTLGPDSTHVLNTLIPVSGFNRIISFGPINDVVRRELFLAAWVRALVIGKKAEALELAKTFREQNIESVLNPALDVYLEEKTDLGRAFRAADIILSNQALSPEVDRFRTDEDYVHLMKYREPLWTEINISTTDEYGTSEEAQLIAFLKPEDMELARSEIQALIGTEHPVAWLAGPVFAYAERNPRDPAVPGALFKIATYGDRFGHPDERVEKETSRSRRLLEKEYKAEFEAMKKERGID